MPLYVAVGDSFRSLPRREQDDRFRTIGRKLALVHDALAGSTALVSRIARSDPAMPSRFPIRKDRANQSAIIPVIGRRLIEQSS